jgi:hypothetical protein
MDKIEKSKVERPGMEDKKGRKVSGHTAECYQLFKTALFSI